MNTTNTKRVKTKKLLALSRKDSNGLGCHSQAKFCISWGIESSKTLGYLFLLQIEPEKESLMSLLFHIDSMGVVTK